MVLYYGLLSVVDTLMTSGGRIDQSVTSPVPQNLHAACLQRSLLQKQHTNSAWPIYSDAMFAIVGWHRKHQDEMLRLSAIISAPLLWLTVAIARGPGKVAGDLGNRSLM